jgi:hypothetical protein
MRRLSRLLLLALLVAVVGFYPLLAPTPHRIDREHFKLIEPGMTKSDVEAICGVPAGQYDWAEPNEYHLQVLHLSARLDELRDDQRIQRHGREISFVGRLVDDGPRINETWISRHGAFVVRFDRGGQVVSKSSGTRVRIVPPWQRWWKAIWGENGGE